MQRALRESGISKGDGQGRKNVQLFNSPEVTSGCSNKICYTINNVELMLYFLKRESQSQDREGSAKIQRYIHHKDTGNSISLFVREYKRNGSYTAPYTFLGNAEYVSHEGERPVSFVWKLHNAIPAELLPKANNSIAM